MKQITAHEWAQSLPECHASPAFNRQQYRLEWWNGDKMLAWASMTCFRGDDWQEKYWRTVGELAKKLGLSVTGIVR